MRRLARSFLGRAACLASLALACTAAPGPEQRRAVIAKEPSTLAPTELELEPVQPLTIGWAERRFDHPKVALVRNKAGLKLHRGGDYAGGLAGFEDALAADPDYAWARYNRACALSRLVRFDEAAEDLDRLLREDLPTFGPRLDGDEDLAGLRESAAGGRLLERREQFTAAWADALDLGVIALSYRSIEPDDEGDQRVFALYDQLRIGVYVPTTRRFVPLAPEVDDAIFAMIDRSEPEAARVLVISGKVVSGDMWVIQPFDIGVHLFDLVTPGRVVTELEHVERGHELLQEHRLAVDATIEGEQVRLIYREVQYASDNDVSVRVSGSRVQILAETEELAPTSEFIHIDGFGADLRGPDPVSADGRVTMHFVLVSSCDEEGATHEYSLARRDAATGATEQLASGDSRAGASLGPEGSIYLEVGGRIERFAPGQREAIADVPSWIHFETPGYGHDCSI